MVIHLPNFSTSSLILYPVEHASCCHRAPLVTPYIRRLDIWSHCFYHLDYPTPPRAFRRTRSLLSLCSSKSCCAKDILSTLTEALPRLRQLDHISLVLDEMWDPVFSDFLSDLLSARGPVIRKLSINATVHKVNELLESHLAALSPFPGLEYLDLKLAASHDFFMEEDLDDLCDAITTFIKSNKQSLRTLIFADPAFIDVSNVFRDLGCLPSLKRLELSIPMLLSTLPRFEYLENFLTLNASTLECLVLKCRRFLLPDDTTQQFLFDVLPRLSLPVLSEFDIGIYSYTKPRVPFHLPSFVHFAPNIKTLKIQFSPNYLNEEDITNLLRNLSEYGLGLRSLHIQVQDLTPDLFLHISSSLPGLTSLRITYAQPRFDGWETVHQVFTNFTS